MNFRKRLKKFYLYFFIFETKKKTKQIYFFRLPFTCLAALGLPEALLFFPFL